MMNCKTMQKGGKVLESCEKEQQKGLHPTGSMAMG